MSTVEQEVGDPAAAPSFAGGGPAGRSARWWRFPRRSPLLWATCVVLAAAVAGVLVYRPALRRPFLLDDWGFLQIADQHTLGSYIAAPDQVVYRPGLVAWMTALWGAVGARYTLFHLAGLAALIVLAALLYALCRRLALGVVPAALAASFVLLHPTMITPVVWAAAANAILAPAFVLVVLLALSSVRVGPWRLAVAGVGTLLALACREDAVVLPVVACLLRLVLPAGPSLPSWRSRLVRLLPTLPVWAVALAYMGLREAVGASTKGTQYELSVGTHVFGNLVTLSEYVLGLPLAARRGEVGVVGWQVAGVAFFLVVAAAAVVLLVRRLPVAAFGIAWALLGAVPSMLLSKHSIDPYYVDILLPGFAVALAALLSALPRPALPSARLRVASVAGVAAFAVVWALVCGHAVREQQGTTAFAVAAERQQQLLAEFGTSPPPRHAILCFLNARSADASITSGGALFRVTYHDPTLRVALVENGRLRQSLGVRTTAPRPLVELTDRSAGSRPPAPGAAALCPAG